MRDDTAPQITIRVTPEEYQAIKGKADKLGLTISSYIRMLALNTEVTFTVGNSAK